MTVIPLLLLAAGGVYIATKVLDKKVAPASTPNQSFEAALAELKNDAAIQKGIADLVTDIGKPVKDSSGNVVDDITKRMREIWNANKAADLHLALKLTCGPGVLRSIHGQGRSDELHRSLPGLHGPVPRSCEQDGSPRLPSSGNWRASG